MSHPYLHEIIKSALIYDSQKVFSEFVLSDGKTKLKNWKLIESRQEYILCSHTKHRIRYEFKYGNPENIKYKICDAVWTMEW
jgi:hypothetical protein